MELSVNFATSESTERAPKLEVTYVSCNLETRVNGPSKQAASLVLDMAIRWMISIARKWT